MFPISFKLVPGTLYIACSGTLAWIQPVVGGREIPVFLLPWRGGRGGRFWKRCPLQLAFWFDKHLFNMLVFAFVQMCAAVQAKLSCGHCLSIQESIQRSIIANISSYERRVHAGSEKTETIQIGQIIWHLCDSDAWKAQRYSDAASASCTQHVRKHVDMMTKFWQEKSTQEYKNMVTGSA